MTDNPYSPPSLENDPSPLGPPASLPLATLGQRFAASLLDSLIVYGPLILIAVFVPFPFLNGLVESEDFLSEAIFAGIAFLLFLIVNLYLIRNHDQTIGKLALGIKVTDLNGGSPSTACQAGLRYSFYHLVTAIPVIGGLLSLINVLLIFDRSRRCLHDLIAGTRVVKCR